MLQEHEPLLTYDLYERFLGIGAGEEAAAAGSKDDDYRELLEHLPPVSRHLLAVLMAHLKKVRPAAGALGRGGTARGFVGRRCWAPCLSPRACGCKSIRVADSRDLVDLRARCG